MIFVSTPYNVNSQIKKIKGDVIGQIEYTQIIRSLMHLMNFIQSNIAYVICRLSRYTQNLNHKHSTEIIWLMRYLRGTMCYNILCSEFFIVLEGYSNVNWISYSDDIESTSDYIFIIDGSAVSWKSSKQGLTVQSTMESGFIALELASYIVDWLRNFFNWYSIMIVKWQYPL